MTVCASESFEALSDGLQNALWELGGVPKRHRSDSLSAAVNNLSATREFQTRYRDLLTHYGLSGQRINVRQAHENGDAESAHGHFKTAVDQALLLRGSRDFASRDKYAEFLQQLVATRNAHRRDRLAEDQRALRDLPDSRLSSCLKVRCRVDSGSLIHIHRNTYSVHSRLRGEIVEAWLFADRVEVWYGDRHVDTLPRLVGRDQHAVHYRHVIDSLVRKPGAFANYAYRDDLFPTTHFRIAYDRFCAGRDERRGAKDYPKILYHAAHNSQVAVDDALRVLLAGDGQFTVEAVIALAKASEEIPAATTVVVEAPDLTEFDSLLTLMEETHGEDANEPDGRSPAEPFDAAAIGSGSADGAVAGSALAGVPGSLSEPSRASGAGEPELPAVPRSVDQPGMRSADAGPHSAPGDGVAFAQRQDLGSVPLVAPAEERAATVPGPARRRLLEAPRERLVFGKPGSGKTHALCAVAEQLVLQGHPVLFATSSLLVQDLLAAKRDLKLERFLKKLAGYEALVIDDLGYVQQSREEMEVLFTLLAERYERGSVMLTSNLPFSQWTAIFKDPMTTAAAIDRLVHHSVIVELNVPSYRLESAKDAKKTKVSDTTSPATTTS